MHIDWWTIALQTVNALVLIWLLGRVLFTPVAKIVAERKAMAAQLLGAFGTMSQRPSLPLPVLGGGEGRRK